MSTPIIPVVTNAGVQAALDAKDNGMQLELTELALGSGAYVPSNAQTALSSEQQRVAIAGPAPATPGQLHVGALVEGPEEYWINELGFFDENGVLFAVWSDPSNPIGYKSAAVDFLVAFDLVINGVDPNAVTVNTLNNDPTVLFVAEQGLQNTRLDALEAAPPGGTDPADEARITTLEASQGTQDSRLDGIDTDQVTQNGRLDGIDTDQVTQDGRLDALEAAPGGGGGTDPADEARITALETSQGTQDTSISGNSSGISTIQGQQTTQDNRLTALEATSFDYADIGVANRLYATRHLAPFCGGALNSPLAHNAGGITSPYSFQFFDSAAGTATIEVVAVQDTARLAALGISRSGVFLALSIDAAAVDFNIAVIDMQCTAAATSGGSFFHIGLNALPFLNSGPPASGASNSYIGQLTKTEIGAWVFAMQIDPAFELRLGSQFTAAIVDSAAVGSGWQFVHDVGDLNPAPGLFFSTTSAQPAGGVCKVAIALPYYGFGYHGGAPVWSESIKDVIDGL